MTETTQDTPPFADILNGSLESLIPVAHKMGVEAVEIRRGHAKLRVPIAGNGNHFGVMYAGVLFTVGEMLGGAIPLATFDNSAYYPLVKDLQIFFKKAAKTDITSEATLSEDEIARIEATAAEHGKCDFELEATLTDTNGVVVATTKGLYQLRALGK